MGDELFARAKEIFLGACARPPSDRSRYLEQQCGEDRTLRAEVESLLTFHQGEGSLAESEVLGGRYRIITALGRGGMGEVFQAHDLVLDEPVAIKLLPEVDPLRLESLLNEVRMARRVTHPSVCRVYDFGERDGKLYMTMELVDGEDLAALLSRIGRLPRDKAVELAHQLCSGLAAAHRCGVLHRDLKPANVMIDGRGRARIMDFGVAARIGRPARAAGTPAYMAPEQWSGGEVGEQSDIYALGLLLYEMVTGEPRLEIDPDGKRRQRPPSAAAAELLGPELEPLVERCLAESPEARPQSIAEVAAALPLDERLQALVAAGLTPSPEDVAAAGQKRAQGVTVNRLALAALVVLLAALPWLADAGLPARAGWASQAPALLVERAREILRIAGEHEPPEDSAWGFHPGAGHYSAGLFWYRQGMDWLLPSRVDSVLSELRVSYDDPPHLDPGMARLELGVDGRLAALEVQAAEVPSEPTGGVGFDPATLLRAAGYDPERLEPVTPEELPPVFADRRLAWRSRSAGSDRLIEAAWLGTRPVFFINLPLEEDLPPVLVLDERIRLGSEWLWNGLFLVIALVALRWARANRIAGRGDLAGANRTAAALLALSAAVWLLGSDLVPDLGAQSLEMAAALGWMLLQAAVAWVVYVALEPFVRRHWPQSLLAWSQLLHGRIRSPLVGRDLVVGSLIGSAWAALDQLDHLAVRALGLEPLVDLFAAWQLDAALHLRSTVANALDSLVDAAYQGLLALFLLAALQRWLAPAGRSRGAGGAAGSGRRGLAEIRHQWLPVLLFTLSIGALEAAEGSHPAVSWLTLGVGIGTVSAIVLLRWGVLSLIVAQAVFYFLQTSPITVELDAWYAETGGVALVLVLGLALLGWWAGFGRAAAPSIADF